MQFINIFLTLLGLVCSVQSANFTNPLKGPLGSGSFIVTFEGYYYFLTTTYNDLRIIRATTLEGLKTGETKVVHKDTEASRSSNVWAPEIHFIDGTWYLYYSAGWAQDVSQQHVHILTGGASPWDPYTYSGQITSEWGIDASVLRVAGSNYLIWSCITDAGQSLCSGQLNSPPTTVRQRSVISNPTEEWEKVGSPVMEGPVALYHGGKTYIVYSASFCHTASYQLAYLTHNGGDPLVEGSWTKTGPSFSSSNGNFGTGHNGQGSCGTDRYTLAQIVNWNADGTPNFGAAPPLTETLEGPSGE